jgi:hypothetical protein
MYDRRFGGSYCLCLEGKVTAQLPMYCIVVLFVVLRFYWLICSLF